MLIEASRTTTDPAFGRLKLVEAESCRAATRANAASTTQPAPISVRSSVKRNVAPRSSPIFASGIAGRVRRSGAGRPPTSSVTSISVASVLVLEELAGLRGDSPALPECRRSISPGKRSRLAGLRGLAGAGKLDREQIES